MDDRLLEWLASDDTGLSSEAIALWLGGRKKHEDWGARTPSDPDDLARCLRLLDKIPEWKSRLGEMADAGGMWPTFVKHWSEMEAVFIEECGGHLLRKGEGRGITCSKTYDLMKLVEARAMIAQRSSGQGGGMSDLHAKLANSHPKLQRGQVWCRTCGHSQRVDGTYAMRHGWPKHCGYTMTIDAPGERFVLSDEIKAFIFRNGGPWLAPSGSYVKGGAATEDEVRAMLGAAEFIPNPFTGAAPGAVS